MPRGGPRPGAGRKPKLPKMPGQVIAHPSSRAVPEPPPVETFEAPEELSVAERDVWIRQAPHAFKARTLTKATALAFERYCRVVVLEQNEAKGSGVGGPNHRGLLKQICIYEGQFMLTANGRAAADAAAPNKPFDEHDEYFGGPL